jgi:hypothetical protein
VRGVLYSAALRAVDGDQTALAVLSDVQSGHPVKQLAALCLTWACSAPQRDELKRALRGLCEAAEQAQRPIGCNL